MNKFIKEMLSNKDDISSKRLSGLFLILLFIIVVISSLFITLTEFTVDLVETALYASLALLGVASIEKLWKK